MKLDAGKNPSVSRTEDAEDSLKEGLIQKIEKENNDAR
jgi:hypothetical protein